MIKKNIAAGVVLVGALLSARQSGQDPLPARDAEVQAAIERVLGAGSEEAQRAALDELRASAGPMHARLVPQLLLRSLAATDTPEAMLMGFVIVRLAIPPEHVVRALVPLLESSDAKLRAEVGNVLSEYEDRSIDRGASFSIYRPLLEEGPAPLGLARHLFEVDPGAALLALARVEAKDRSELRPLLLAHHEVEDALWRLRFGFVAPEDVARELPRALEQLRWLSRHARWWARLYAARAASEAPAPVAADIVDALREDAHALVREAAAAVPERR